MSFQYLDETDNEYEDVPEYVKHEALNSERRVIKIIWDEDDIPDHAKGYVQWSVRPYRVSDKCDGTRDSCAMYALKVLGERKGIDVVELANRAYPDDVIFDDAYLDHLKAHRELVEIPRFNRKSISLLLRSLYDMNWRSLVYELEEALGVDMAN
ncbi:hypothetical protein [Idiomarina abyssalis]|uniref:Uncharacterized protein n=1 Tax=Idiomarina abyssalis TaxID=86102 RepID=A0A8I1GAT0_9GAMM|nr:hypothetical protein [Idiomarina abyssalis]MBJ7265531.1 hypothetical protein [Idiomarina abyssalis]MBJ7316795.1 hypothetical protein [Idiomarina abyssalis]